MLTIPHYGIVGRGRLACHLKHYFALEGISLTQWHREYHASAELTLAACDVIIIAIKDDEIAPWIESQPHLKNKKIIHCSGALSMDQVQGFHPLCTFAKTLYGLETYRAIPFICEKGSFSFREIFPTLQNPIYEIEASQKGLYHALCVIMGNLPTLLWQRSLMLGAQTLNLPPQVFAPLLEKTLANTLTESGTALTGPIARQDWQTIHHHLSVLPDPQLKQIYQLFLKLFSEFPCHV
jgi:2-dehydropantoate 2-reductase